MIIVPISQTTGLPMALPTTLRRRIGWLFGLLIAANAACWA